MIGHGIGLWRVRPNPLFDQIHGLALGSWGLSCQALSTLRYWIVLIPRRMRHFLPLTCRVCAARAPLECRSGGARACLAQCRCSVTLHTHVLRSTRKVPVLHYQGIPREDSNPSQLEGSHFSFPRQGPWVGR